MKYSENYGFALPTADDDTLADIGEISKNFKTVDRVMKKNEDLGTELNKNVHNLDMELGLTQANLHKVEARVGSWAGSGNLYDMVKAAKTDISALKTKDTNLQSQIDALGGVDMSEIQSQLDTKVDKVDGKGLSTNDYTTADKNKVGKIEDSQHRVPRGSTVQSQIDEINDSAFSTSNPNSLTNKVGSSISQLDSKTTLLQSQIDTKVDKVEGKGLSTNDYDDRAEEKVSKIGDVSKIPTASRYIVDWIQDVYDSVFKSSADNTCLADRVATEISHRESADTHLQSQIDTKVTRKVAVVGSDTVNSDGWYKVASGTMSKYQVISLLFAVHTPAKSGKYSGILQLDLRGGTEAILTGDEIKLGWLVRAGFDLSQVMITVDGYNWALYYNLRSNQNFRVFFEVIQESTGTDVKPIYNLHIDSVVEETTPLATATSTDLGTVNTANKLTTARNINGIAFDGSADINITANDIESTLGPQHNLGYEIVMTKAYLSAVEASIGSWSRGETISDTIFELQKSTLDLDRKVTSTRDDLDAVKARIGSWGTGKTLYAMIADLTARIEALENSAS